MANRSDRHLLNLSNSQGTKARSPDQEEVRGFPSWPGVQRSAPAKGRIHDRNRIKQSETATLRTGLGPYMRVRNDCPPPPSPLIGEFNARTGVLGACAPEFEHRAPPENASWLPRWARIRDFSLVRDLSVSRRKGRPSRCAPDEVVCKLNLIQRIAEAQAKRVMLLGPLIGQPGSARQPLGGEVRRLASRADRFDDRWREKRERDQTSHVAVAVCGPFRMAQVDHNVFGGTKDARDGLAAELDALRARRWRLA